MLRERCLAVLAGVALTLDGPPAEHGVGGVLFAPMLFLALRDAVRERAVARAAGLGALAGLAFGCGSFVWVATAVERFAPASAALAWPATVAVVLLAAAAPALAGALHAYAARDDLDAASFALASAAAFALVPQLFPFRPIAMAIPFEPIAGLVPLLGTTAAEALVALAASAFAAACCTRDLAAALRSLAFAIVCGCVGASEVERIEAMRAAAPRTRLGVVQTDVTVEEGRDRTRRDARLRALRDEVGNFAVRGVDAVLLPESVHPLVYDRRATVDRASPQDIGARRFGVPVVVGAGTSDGACHRWNGVVAFDASGRRIGLVDKERRMPFADVGLLGFVGLDPRSDAARCDELRAAEASAPLDAFDGLGAFVCYDEVEPDVARRRVRDGASHLVGFTNDAWFRGTRQPVLHERVARLRALETGRDLVRVVNGGPSAHFGANGRILRRLPEGAAGRFVAEVARLEPSPLVLGFGRFADALVGIMLIVRARQRRRTSSSGGGR